MKIIKKAELITNGAVDIAKLERQITEHANHPFITNLIYSFQDPEKIYFVTSYASGGTLRYHINQNGKFPEPWVQFYAAQILLALEQLHSQNILYRDVKPENINMFENGYISLTDFGMAKQIQNDEFTSSFVGTPEYLAPEIILSTGHNFLADWWSFGILIYEMLTGDLPFNKKNRTPLYTQITENEVIFPMDSHVSDPAMDLIHRLTIKSPPDRFGANGAQEIKEHPFFAGFSFQDCLRLSLTAPMTPVGECNDFMDQFATSSPKANRDSGMVDRHASLFEDFD